VFALDLGLKLMPIQRRSFVCSSILFTNLIRATITTVSRTRLSNPNIIFSTNPTVRPGERTVLTLDLGLKLHAIHARPFGITNRSGKPSTQVLTKSVLSLRVMRRTGRGISQPSISRSPGVPSGTSVT
jgi:hypothetical protein